ncbi:TPA: hypothetical protein ACX3CA_003521 [Vibrio parahaemolyticus]
MAHIGNLDFESNYISTQDLDKYSSLSILFHKIQQKSNTRDTINDFLSSNFINLFLAEKSIEIMNDKYRGGIISQDVFKIFSLDDISFWFGKVTDSNLSNSEISTCNSNINGIILGRGEVEFIIYELPFNCDEMYFTTDVYAQYKKKLKLKNGSFYSMSSGREALKVLSTSSNMYHFYATSSPSPLVWHFDAKSLRAIYCSAGCETDSSIVICMEVLAKFGYEWGVSGAESALQSRLYFVRWAAVKCILSLNLQLGLEYVNRCLKDPHPELRNVARTTLEQLGIPTK